MTFGQHRAYQNVTSEYSWHLFHPDVFDQAKATSTSPVPLNEGEFETITFDVTRYMWRLGILFVGMAIVWFVLLPRYSQLKKLNWLVPCGLYVLIAVWRLLYVPCMVIVRSHYYSTSTERAETRALWDIGTARVRYGLIFFEEFVLLILLLACYGCLLVLSPHLRGRLKALVESLVIFQKTGTILQ